MNHLGNTGEDGEQDNGAVSEGSESNPNATAEEYRTRGLPAGPVPGITDSVTSGLTKKDSLILVVDDQVDNVALLSFDLQQKGYRVVTATNGVEAVRVAVLMKPNLILMDISMPELDGLAATSKIREDESLRAVPVIAVTAFTTAGFRRAAYDVGFDGYITKPIELQQLHELIVRLLSQTQDRDQHSSGGITDSDTGRS
jgi:CheY-like chemotaxis protein